MSIVTERQQGVFPLYIYVLDMSLHTVPTSQIISSSMESKDTLELGPSAFSSTDLVVTPLSRHLPFRRRYCLLGVMILANVVDGMYGVSAQDSSRPSADRPSAVMSSAAFLVFTGDISRDLDIAAEQQSWVIVGHRGSSPWKRVSIDWPDSLYGSSRRVATVLG